MAQTRQDIARQEMRGDPPGGEDIGPVPAPPSRRKMGSGNSFVS